MTDKVVLITGVTCQDGALLAEFLLDRGYGVNGIKRRASSFNAGRVDHLIQEARPDEIRDWAAQPHVHVSFEASEFTSDADGLGTLRLLEAIRIPGTAEKVAFFQSSASELCGDATKARTRLGWAPRTTFHELVGAMVVSDWRSCAERSRRAGRRGPGFPERRDPVLHPLRPPRPGRDRRGGGRQGAQGRLADPGARRRRLRGRRGRTGGGPPRSCHGHGDGGPARGLFSPPGSAPATR